ncbi:MAG: hypothetical protein C4551_05350 [Bacillota bacterium]|nr:MAG: hypothetical protein C4551_05350 [Bacillota bacterium]
MSPIVDIKRIADWAMPAKWSDVVPPTIAELREMGRKLRPPADPGLCYIARANDGDELIGVIIALPDYNQVLAKLNGRLFPSGFLKFLWYRRSIDGTRFFVGFVVPEWRKRGDRGHLPPLRPCRPSPWLQVGRGVDYR